MFFFFSLQWKPSGKPNNIIILKIKNQIGAVDEKEERNQEKKE